MPEPPRSRLDAAGEALRGELVRAGLCRKPGDAGPPADEPWPCYLHPADGAVGPGDKSGVEANSRLVLSVMQAPEIVPSRFDETVTPGRQVRYRAKNAQGRLSGSLLAARVAAQVRALIVPPRAHWNFLLAQGRPEELRVVESLVWTGFQPEASSAEHGWTFVESYVLQIAP